MRIHIRLSRRQAKELRAVARASRTSCAGIVGAALKLQVLAPDEDPEPPLAITPILAARLTRTGGLLVEFGDGEVATICAMEVKATLRGVTRCEVADGGTGLRLFDTEGRSSWFPWEFFWPAADPLVRAACDRAALQRRMATGRQLRTRRKGRDWTVRRLAQTAGVSRKTLKAIEFGRSDATRAELEAVASALGLEANKLFA